MIAIEYCSVVPNLKGAGLTGSERSFEVICRKAPKVIEFDPIERARGVQELEFRKVQYAFSPASLRADQAIRPAPV